MNEIGCVRVVLEQHIDFGCWNVGFLKLREKDRGSCRVELLQDEKRVSVLGLGVCVMCDFELHELGDDRFFVAGVRWEQFVLIVPFLIDRFGRQRDIFETVPDCVDGEFWYDDRL